MSAPKIIVVIEGGIVQGVCTNDPALIGVEYTTLDYDVEGSDQNERTDIEQSDGDVSEAIVGGGQIEELTVKIP
jgi:hypothetical protein